MSATVLGIIVFIIDLTLACPDVTASFTEVADRRYSALVTTAVADPQSNPDEARELTRGQPIEREIAAGQTHSYHITLESGQYLNVVVEQLGVNVELKLSAPNGRQLASLDWWWREGRELLWALAESSGDYTLKVDASSKPDETGKYQIRIEKIGEWKTASAVDHDYVTAYKLFAEGESLVAQGTAESLHKATEKYQEALRLWRALKDVDAEAQSLNALGVVEYRAGNLKQAADYFGRAIILFRDSGNRRAEANSLNSLAYANLFSGDAQKALENYNQALPVARTVKDDNTHAAILSGLGATLNRLGQTQKALEFLNESVALSHAAGLKDAEAAAHNNIGVIFIGLGRLREAVEQYSQTLSLLRVIENQHGESSTLSNIGNAYARMGEFQKALENLFQSLSLKRKLGDRRGEALTLASIGYLNIRFGDYLTAEWYYNQSLTISRAIEDKETEAIALQNLGAIYVRTGDLQKALDYADQSLTILVKLGNRSVEASALATLGSAHSRLGDSEKALGYYEKALTIKRELGDQYAESQFLSAIGVIYTQLTNQPKAIEYLNQALSLARSIGDRPGEIETLHQLARLERQRGDFTKARNQIEAALELLETSRTKVVIPDARAIYFASRQELYEFYIDLLMQLYKSHKDQSYLATSLQTNERRFARSLLDSLAESQANISAYISPELIERERRLRQDINAKADQHVRLLSRKHTADQADALVNEMDSLTTEYERALAQIRESGARYAALTQPSTLTLNQIQSETLDSDTLLLEYSLGEEKSYLWVVSSNNVSAYELPKRAEIESLARQVYELLTARNRRGGFETAEERRVRIKRADIEYNKAAGALSKMILAPASSRMNKKRLLIVSDGALQYLPFAALPAPHLSGRGYDGHAAPLIALHEVVSLPSASTLAALRKDIAGRKTAPKTVAVLADPVFSRDDQRLKTSAPKPVAQSSKEPAVQVGPLESSLTRSVRDLAIDDKELLLPRLRFTRQEAETIVRLVPEKQFRKALDFAANKGAATDPELSQYKYVHLATHTLLNSKNPGLSGIVLSLVDERGAEQEGFLVAHEIYNLKLLAELVVLSSCKTGLGKEVKGEGIIGITRGFMYAGAARVLVSLWDVDDESTAEMMKRLYEAMLRRGLSPADALRSAQVSMLKSTGFRAPYFWAAFVLQGEYK